MAKSTCSRGQIRHGLARARRILPSCLAALLLALGAATPSAAHSDKPRRIVRLVDNRDTRVVRGSMHALAKSELDEGRVEATLELDRVAMVFKPSPAQDRELETLLAEQRDPSSPSYHKWLTPDEYASRFGMNDADLAEVGAWLRAQGFTVQATARNHNELSFRGSAAQVEYALRTEIHRYRVGGRVHFANATEPSVPVAFADVVLAIRKLSDFRPQPRLRRAAVAPRFTSAITGVHFLAPDDFATIYNLQPLYAAGYDGAGQRIAVVGQSALGPADSAADIAAFRAAAGLPAANLQQILVPGTGSSTVCSDDVLEAHLDVEWSGAVARNATIVYVFPGVRSGRTCNTTDGNVWDSLQYAVTNNLAPIISTSYGACEAENGKAFAQTVRGWVQQANAQGQTVTAAAGDMGAADCEPRGSQSATTGLAVDVPASIPEVTGVGGTEFQADFLSPDAYWSPTNNQSNGSATDYIPEVAWNDTALSLSFGGGLAASGGGASGFFSKPSWQSGAGVPADGSRDLPDVSLAASANHDGILICSQGSCVDGFRDANLFLTVIGGTSAASPSLAGILALINQGTGSNGLGNINPRLYALAATAPGVFHDITAGSNAVPCSRGSANCPARSPFQLGFNAGAGYDQVTGLGSVDAFALADRWATKIATTTSLSASSSTVASGASVTFSATVAALASGTGSPSGGVVQFEIDGGAAGSPAIVTRVGTTYRASYTTSALAGGAHTVAAEYLGNLVHLASASSPVTVTVNVADFTLLPSPASIGLSAGGTGSSIITVATADGFAGTVTLACTPPGSSARVTCALNPTSLTLSAGAPSQTATLTITTTAAKARAAKAATAASLLAAVLLMGASSRRRRRVLAPALALFVLVGAGSSCGGGGGGGGGASAAASAGTPAGSYPIRLNATSGSISHAASVLLAVK